MPRDPQRVIGTGRDDARRRPCRAHSDPRSRRSQSSTDVPRRAGRPGPVGRVHAGIEHGHDRAARRGDRPEHRVPADLRQRPLVAVGGVVRRALGFTDAVAVDADHRGIRPQGRQQRPSRRRRQQDRVHVQDRDRPRSRRADLAEDAGCACGVDATSRRYDERHGRGLGASAGSGRLRPVGSAVGAAVGSGVGAEVGRRLGRSAPRSAQARPSAPASAVGSGALGVGSGVGSELGGFDGFGGRRRTVRRLGGRHEAGPSRLTHRKTTCASTTVRFEEHADASATCYWTSCPRPQHSSSAPRAARYSIPRRRERRWWATLRGEPSGDSRSRVRIHASVHRGSVAASHRKHLRRRVSSVNARYATRLPGGVERRLSAAQVQPGSGRPVPGIELAQGCC
jgi:hypothetical protein